VTPVRILYLEDNTTDEELLCELLREGGIAFVITRVETEETFRAALETGDFDLILSDNALPRYDGLSALARAREHSPELPFIFVSGTLGEEAAIDSLKAGATDYVLKGRLSRLVPAVRRALQEAEAQSARRHYEARVHQLAFYDALTGLPNRALLEDRLRMAATHAQRLGQGVAVLFLDIDRFKPVNDTFGHPVGDVLLREVAERLKRCLREGDTAARWGGDEFIVLLPGLSGERELAAEAALIVLKKVRSLLDTPVTLEGQDFEPSVSTGVALFPWDGASATDLIKHADTAMYQAKASGRSTYQFFTQQMDVLARERLFLERDLRLALRRLELSVHYQPQVGTRGDKIVGAEALLRWRQPDRGWISPTHFIPLAEEAGQISAFGEWVLECVLAQIESWRAKGFTVPPISVNVSPYQLQDPAFAQAVLRLLTAHDLPPQCLALEFTEGALLAEETRPTVLALADLGVALAVDDFGTGYSSLSYLKRFPIHALKIDQSFVRDLETDPHDTALVKAIIAMGRSFGLRVVAEGVETQQQRALLAKFGCREYQGFLFSPAVPAEEMEPLLTYRPA
jgi:diguanylate cyclase (GGDEF)-like protein